jgi:hypothetical protein
MRARAAAYAQWAAEPDWTARTAKARAGMAAKFERLALEKHPGASGPELAKYAEVERKKFYAEMTLKSARARAKRAGKAA